jgi:hypothetical protein
MSETEAWIRQAMQEAGVDYDTMEGLAFTPEQQVERTLPGITTSGGNSDDKMIMDALNEMPFVREALAAPPHPVDRTRAGADRLTAEVARVAGVPMTPAKMKQMAKYGVTEADDKYLMSKVKDVAYDAGAAVWRGTVKGAEGIFDLAQRGEYAVLAAIKAPNEMLVNVEKLLGADSPAEALDALYRTVKSSPPIAAAREIFSGVAGIEGKKEDWVDVVHTVAPEWAEENPWSAMAIGMGMGIALDPLTYLSFGTAGVMKAGIRVGGSAVSKKVVGKTLTRQGEQFFKAAREAGSSNARAWKMIADTVSDTTPIPKKFFQKAEGNIIRKGDEHIVTSIGLPFSRGQDYLIRVPGLKALRGAARELKNSKFGEAAIVKFSRKGIKAEVPDGLRNRIDTILKDAAKENRVMEQFARKYLIPLGDEGRVRVGQAMVKIRDKTDEWFRINQGKLASDAVEVKGIRREVFKELGLSQDEITAAGRLYHMHQRWGLMEKELGLMKELTQNYTPYIYNMIKDGKAFNALLGGRLGLWNKHFNRASKRINKVKTDALGNEIIDVTLGEGLRLAKGKPGARHTPLDKLDALYAQYQKAIPDKKLPEGLPWAKDRIFKSLDEARDAGLAPEMDALKLYLMRGLGSVRARRNAMLNEAKETFLKKNAGKLDARTTRMIDEEMELYGDVTKVVDNTFDKDFQNAYDNLLSVFKRSATIARVGFVFRTGMDELTRASILAGTRAYKGYDADAFRIAGQITEFVHHADMDKLAKLKFTNAWGDEFTGMDVHRIVRDHAVVQGKAMGGVGGGIGAERMLARFDKEVALGTAAGKGRKRVWTEALKYWRYPEKLTDMMKTMHVINGLKLGMDEAGAAKRALDISFDYANGLSKFEEKIMTRIMPFYTFNRFAIPALAKATVKSPGRVATFGRVQRQFFESINKLYNGFDTGKDTKLTEAERRSLDGNYILEMPVAFLGSTAENRGRFMAFNNFSLVDTFQTGVYDRRGNLDWARTAEKTVLATLTPFIKAPAESLWDYTTFSGRKISDSGKWASAGDFYKWMDEALPNDVKRFIGFEVAKDFEGKDTVYVNPMMLFAGMNMFPVLRDFQRLMDPGDNFGTKAMEVIGGTSVFDRDLAAGAERMVHGFKSEAGKIKSQIKKDATRDAERSVEEDFDELIELYTNLGPSVNTVEQALKQDLIRRATDVEVAKEAKRKSRKPRKLSKKQRAKKFKTVFPRIPVRRDLND